MEWIMYTVGTVAHIWTAMVVLGLIFVGRDSVTNRIRVSPCQPVAHMDALGADAGILELVLLRIRNRQCTSSRTT